MRDNAASPLWTDLYQLTMMAGYVATGRHDLTSTFELFARRLPPRRNYLLAAGLAPLLEYLRDLRFTEDEIAWLREQPALGNANAAFFDYLRGFRFTGEVWAVPEGTPVFPNEPLVRVTAPLAQAQLIETAALAFVNFPTSVASKASRVVVAADGRPVMEFGARRAHGIDAALHAARAAYIAGCSSTSLVEAGRVFGIPLSGTMAHSWVLAADREVDAFTDYARLFGASSVLLLDTFDTLEAARTVVAAGLKPSAVRIDSGDLLQLSREVRRILDTGGLQATKIVASGDLDEFIITRLLGASAPIDAFGVGTAITTSSDAPALGGVYKLVELVQPDGHRRGVMKRSTGKATWPGRKQIWRLVRDGQAERDVIAFEDEQPPEHGVALLSRVMAHGRVLASPSLDEARSWARARLHELPRDVLSVEGSSNYPADPSARLEASISRVPTP